MVVFMDDFPPFEQYTAFGHDGDACFSKEKGKTAAAYGDKFGMIHVRNRESIRWGFREILVIKVAGCSGEWLWSCQKFGITIESTTT